MDLSFRRLLFLFLILLSFFGLAIVLKSPPAAAEVNLGPWQESASYLAFRNSPSHPLPSFSVAGYFYVLLANNERDIIYAIIKNDGSLDSWQLATAKHNEGSGRGYTAVVVGSIPYLLRYGRVEKLIIDGLTGNVTQIIQVGSAGGGQDRVGDSAYYWNSAAAASFPGQNYVFHLGGFDMIAYGNNNNIYRCGNTSSSQWNWEPLGQGPYQNPYKAAFYLASSGNYGYLYTSDLNPDSKPIYRIKVLSNGNFEGGWLGSGNLPAGDDNSLGDYFIRESSFFAVRGSKVFKAVINDNDGSLSAWSQVSSLPRPQIDKNWGPSVGSDHTEGPSFGIFNNFVYLTGQEKVYYSSISGQVTPTTTLTPTLTPTTTPGATLTPTLTPSPTPPPCLDRQKAGDYDCSGVVNMNDYEKWQSDFLSGKTTFSFFEYWRRAFYQ